MRLTILAALTLKPPRVIMLPLLTLSVLYLIAILWAWLTLTGALLPTITARLNSGITGTSLTQGISSTLTKTLLSSIWPDIFQLLEGGGGALAFTVNAPLIMIITFCNNRSEKNVIRKTLDNAMPMEGTLREDTSVINPIITVEAPVTIITFNYCYIPDFSRYYYVVDVKSLHNNLWAVTLRVDVLMSFQNDILNTPAIIDHTSESDITDYMESPIWGSLVKDNTNIINFSSGLSNSGGYVLITAGG